MDLAVIFDYGACRRDILSAWHYAKSVGPGRKATPKKFIIFVASKETQLDCLLNYSRTDWGNLRIHRQKRLILNRCTSQHNRMRRIIFKLFHFKSILHVECLLANCAQGYKIFDFHYCLPLFRRCLTFGIRFAIMCVAVISLPPSSQKPPLNLKPFLTLGTGSVWCGMSAWKFHKTNSIRCVARVTCRQTPR